MGKPNFKLGMLYEKVQILVTTGIMSAGKFMLVDLQGAAAYNLYDPQKLQL